MRKLKIGLIFISIVIFFISCDCSTRIQGFVIAKETQNPIENVNVQLIFKKSVSKINIELVKDSITIEERKKIIKELGNNENWNQRDNSNYMYKIAPVLTDKNGFFNIYYVSGFCPKKLKFVKSDYKDLIIKRKKITKDSLNFEMIKLK